MIAGSAKRMPKDVKQALVDVMKCHGQLTQEETEQRLQLMTRRKKLIVEAWS